MNETVGAYLSQGLSIDLDEARELATRHGLEYGSMVHNLDEDAHGTLQRLIVEHAASQEHMDPTIETRLGPVVERVRLLFRRYILQLQPHRFQGVEGPAIERSILGFLSQPPLDASSQEVLQSVQEVLDDDERWSMHGTQALIEGVHEPWMHLGDLSMTLNLSELERDLLWLLLTPEVEPRFLWMYRCVTGRQEQVSWQESFLQALVDPSGAHLARVRNALSAQGKLLRMGLVRVHSPNHLATDRRLRVDARLVQRILGVPLHSGPVDGLGRFLAADDLEREDPFDIFPAEMRSKMQKILRKKRRVVLVAPPGSGALRLVRRIQAGPGDPLIRVHAEELVEGGPEAIAAVLRETLLERAGLFVHDFEALESERLKLPAWKLDALLEHLALCQTPLFIASSSTLSARMQHRVASALNAETVALPALEASTRADLWRRHLTDIPLEEDLDTIVTQAHTWPLDVDDIERAVQIASAQARQRATSPSLATVALDDIEAACSEMTTPKLRTLAVRVRTRFSWDDIILPEATSESLQDLINFGRYSDLVLNEWDFARKMPYGRGLSAMLSGPSGTGKTMVSGLISKELGRELYRIDLSQIVSKYIGETEEHLSALFAEATAGGVALLFDEADSLFGKRTSVKSSNDRYANLEVNFLLQKIEEFDGLVLLTTNFPSSIDEAFMRRLKFKIHFPKPDPELRAQLWMSMLPKAAPVVDDLKVDTLAERFELTGGQIKNAVFRAALYAAEKSESINFNHLERAALLEYREAGRIVFGNKAEESKTTIIRS